jgi:hypothetical protein
MGSAMSSRQSIKFVVKDAERLADVVLSKADGGNHLEKWPERAPFGWQMGSIST